MRKGVSGGYKEARERRLTRSRAVVSRWRGLGQPRSVDSRDMAAMATTSGRRG